MRILLWIWIMGMYVDGSFSNTVTLLTNILLRKSTSLMSLLLLYLKTLEIVCSQYESHSLLSCFFSMYHGFWHYYYPPKSSNLNICTHRVVIIVINAMLTLCSSTSLHATSIHYCHASTLPLHVSLISCALWLPHAWYLGGLSVLQCWFFVIS